jgi:hypothetical protein
MPMKPFSVSVTIDRTRDEVFAHLDVLAHHVAYLDHFIADCELSGPPSGVGAHMRFRSLSPGRKEWMDSTIIAVTRGVESVERTIGARGKRRLRGTYRLTDAGPGATLVTFTLVTEAAPAVEALVTPLARPWLIKQNGRALERLKEQLEARTGVAAAA